MPIVGIRSSLRDALRDRRGHGLEHEQERARGLGGMGVVQQAQRRLGGLALCAVAALRGRRLRRQPEVGDDRDAGAGQRADAREHRARALQLDGLRGGLLEEPPGGAQGVLVAHLVRHERQVGDHEGAPAGARDRRGQHEHLVHRGRHRRAVAEHGHRARVADEHEIDAGALGDAPGRVVVGRDHDQRAAVALGLRDLLQRQPAGGFGSGRSRHASSSDRLSIRRVVPRRAATSRMAGRFGS